MRTISSLTSVGTLLPPWNAGLPPLNPLLAGKMPACSRAVALGSIMQVGIVLFGKAAPETIPAGATPPGQFLNRYAALAVGVDPAKAGTLIGMLPKLPPYQAVSGTVWFRVCP